MSLEVYSTLSRKKEKFEPIEPGKVRMYCCGPTVYGLLHVGNFRGAIFYNLVRNWLEHLGYKVTYIYNYTDVDDKIIDRANNEKVSAKEVAEKYIAEFEKDFGRLKLKKHDQNPRVSDYMKPIENMIQKLVENGKAYDVKGEVLFSIKAFDGYGKLSNRNPDDLKVGVRAEVSSDKKDPLDFTLWKPAKPGEPFWESQWGKGRPGWHIECSAMANAILGEQIDIHGGGHDLIFPHHENEIAQSEGCSGKQYARYWMHNNLINFSGAKMSKSLGNIIPARDFMDEYNPEIFKYMMLSAHYRSVTDFGDQAIEHTVQGLARIYSALGVADSYLKDYAGPKDPAFDKITTQAWANIEAALNDDFSTPEAFAELFNVIRQYNGAVKRGMKSNPAIQGKSLALKEFILKFGSFMSLFQEPAAEFLHVVDDMLLRRKGLLRSNIDQLVADRWQARVNKEFKRSDEIRDELTKMGIAVSDSATGSEWEVAK